MPSLYGTTGSTSNVEVTSTTGLYQMTSNTIVLTSAQQLLALLDNNGNVNFALDPANNYNTIYSYFKGNAGGGSGGTLTLVGDVVAVGTVGSPITTYITASGVTAGTYGNTSYIPVITVNSQGRITSANTVNIGTLTSLYSNANVASYLPVYGGNMTAANVTATYFIGNGSHLTGIVATSSYGNSTVAAFLKNFGTNSISTTGNVTATYFIGDGSKITGITANSAYGNTQVAAFLPTYTGIITAGEVLTNNYLYANGQPFLGAYGNTQVSAYLASGSVTSNISTTTNLTAGNVLTNNYLFANGVNILSTVAGTYSNVNVAAYLSSNTDPTISNLNANTQQQQTQINLINSNVQIISANLGGFETYANATYSTIANAGSQQTQINSTNSNVQTLSANVGAFETYANATFVTSGAAYSNVNVAAYLTTATINTTGNITGGNITTVGRTTTGNLKTTAGIYWANGVNYSTTISLSTYGNANVAAWLADSTTTANIYLTNITTANIYQATITNGLTVSGQNGIAVTDSGAEIRSYSSQGGDGTLGNSSSILNAGTAPLLSVRSAALNIAYGTGAIGGLKVMNAANIANIQLSNGTINLPVSSLGIFWGNGDPYSSGVYGNANVAAYLPTYSGSLNNSSTIITINSNVQTLSANLGAFQTATNNSLAGANASIQTLSANLGSFQTYANATFGTSNYGNANVVAYLASPVADLTIGSSASGNVRFPGFTYLSGTTNINGVILNVSAIYIGTQSDNASLTATSINTGAVQTQGGVGIAKDLRVLGSANIAGTVTMGNVASYNGFFWANGVSYASTVSGYSNATVASYLPISTVNFGGNINTVSGNARIVAASNVVDMSINTGALGIPLGANSARPIHPSPGSIRFNTATTVPEWYDISSNTWVSFGGTAPSVTYTLSYAVVAGGGGGAGNGGTAIGGGGGGGGVLTGGVTTSPGTTFTVSAGGGGAAGSGTTGSNGTDSTVTGGITLTAVGGGGGGYGVGGAGSAGGSGGGGAVIVTGTNYGAGTGGQGYRGGSGQNNGGGGGGGGSAVGSNATGGATNNGGNGGNGYSISIPGYTGTCSGGGGGGAYVGGGGTPGSGGTGGGGSGATASPANTGTDGGGGGGGSYNTSNVVAANGGGGFIILTVPTGNYSGVVSGASVSTSGGYTIMLFGGSGYYTA
jgi:hypothetical protein